jgi:outer membrane protein assembly factor BamB
MLQAFAHEATPLVVKGVLYTSTSLSQVAAINAATGETIWVYNPESYKVGRPTNLGLFIAALRIGPMVARSASSSGLRTPT